MSRFVAILFLAGALVVPPARANADDAIPPVVIPTVPAQARAVSDLVPDGWIVETEVDGDLNADGVPDRTLVLRMNAAENRIASDGPGSSPFDTNPRMLVVAFADAATGALSLALADHTLIPRHTDPMMEDPLDDVAVVRGTLQVSVGSAMTAGGWTIWRSKFTFRYQDGCFKLIGHDGLEIQRNTGKMSTVSVNYLTNKFKRSSGYADGAMNDFWGAIPATDLPCLDAVGDGLEFSPEIGDGLAPGAKSAQALLKAAAEAEPGWSTTIASLHVGSGDESATFADVRSTCGETDLARALATTAAELHGCLDPSTTVGVTVVFAGGQVASRVEPDDEWTDCVITALDHAHFDDLTCTFEANVSSP